jgi:hypothetical protein
MNALRQAALAFHDNGYCVVPARADGSKAPGLKTWRQHQHQRPSREQVATWTSNGAYDGFGLICGAVSGHLEMLELEGRAVTAGMLEQITSLAHNSGLGDLWDRVTDGYLEETPSGGIHLLYRVDSTNGGTANPNTKLARDADGLVLAETRGEGGFVVVAPSAGRTHPTGKSWMMRRGDPTTIATITEDERGALYDLARALDQTPDTEPAPDPRPQPRPEHRDGTSPGDDYNQRASWHDILIPHGWVHVHQHGKVTYWRRPGKTTGVSATTGRNDGDNLYVFTTSTQFEAEKPYSKFAATTLLEHGGDFRATARALAAAGYGDQHQPPRHTPGTHPPPSNDHPPPPAGPEEQDPDAPQLRRIVLTPASAIPPRRVRWLWDGRIAYGTLALLAGREGLGKSTLAYDVAARISRGQLEGEDHGHPRAVIICAAEDSWAHTIVPRLIAAGADLDMVYRVEMVTHDNIHLGISLPRDFTEVADVAAQTKAGLFILDPLMSVIDAKLDTHRDREVRTALEPLAALADKSRMGILGLIHHNKSGSNDALQLVMGSKAFAAVARSVHTCIPDPDDETQARRLFATSKNNLGRLDLPVLGFTITSHAVETADDGTAWTGRLNWTGAVEASMQELMNRASVNDDDRTATTEAADWLADYLHQHGGAVASADAKRAALKEGHSDTTLKRARKKLRLIIDQSGMPRRTYWSLPAEPDKPVDITEPRKHPEPPTTAPAAGPSPDPSGPKSSETTDTLSGVSSSQANYTPRPETTASRATVGPTPGPTDPTGPDLRKHPETRPRAHTRAHAGGDGPTDLTDSLAPLASHTARQSGQSGQSDQAPTRATPLDPPTTTEPVTDIPTCSDCGWPFDSHDHEINCYGGPA